MVELDDIFRRHGPDYRARFGDRMPPSHLAAMQDIEQCRTEALGGHVYQCTNCEELEYSYHSCKNRHCPKCQNEEATRWLQKQRELLLPVPYFLVTFTLPEQLRPLARSHQKLMYNLLFHTSAAALQALALDPKYLSGQIAMLGVLHTWTRDMAYTILMSITSCPQQPCRQMGRAGSLPAMRIGWCRCRPSPNSSGARSSTNLPKPTGSVTCPPTSGTSHG